MGITFTEGSGCNTCMDNSCHSTVPSSFDGNEYNVHISTDEARTTFKIHATEQASTVSDSDIDANFTNEYDAVRFVRKNFPEFECF